MNPFDPSINQMRASYEKIANDSKKRSKTISHADNVQNTINELAKLLGLDSHDSLEIKKLEKIISVIEKIDVRKDYEKEVKKAVSEAKKILNNIGIKDKNDIRAKTNDFSNILFKFWLKSVTLPPQLVQQKKSISYQIGINDEQIEQFFPKLTLSSKEKNKIKQLLENTDTYIKNIKSNDIIKRLKPFSSKSVDEKFYLKSLSAQMISLIDPKKERLSPKDIEEFERKLLILDHALTIQHHGKTIESMSNKELGEGINS